MLVTTITSCGPHTVYKTKTEYVTVSKEWIQPCEAVPVQEGAKSAEELLNLLSIAYVDTLKNINACNIKLKQANIFVDKYSAKEDK